MKISILIPTYNYDCLPLLQAISSQAEKLRATQANEAHTPQEEQFDYEILLGDDCSTDERIAQRNRAFCQQHPRCRYIQQPQNGGQARNRNTLARAARYTHLLLLDCDTLPANDHFLSDYLRIGRRAPVVCGQLLNPATAPKGCELRIRYEKSAEGRRPATYRNAHPYDEFCAFNLLLHKEVFAQVCFDERCTEYGYEDALFGLALQEKGIRVLHADIPLIHMGFDNNRLYLQKTETALRTLRKLGQPMQSRAHIHRTAQALRKTGLIHPLRLFHRLAAPLMRMNLTSHHPAVFILQLYKLGYYISLP